MRHRFHEWPLVAFTTLAIAGSGLLAVAALASVRGPAWWGLAALVSGFAVSTAHLGHPARAPRSLARVGRSPLSTEILSGGVTVALGVVWLATAPAAGAPRTWVGLLRVAAAASAAWLLLAMGLVYRLPGQRTWRGAAVLGPPTAGLAVGALLVVSVAGDRAPWIEAAAWFLLAADAIGAILRWRAASPRTEPALPVHGGLFEHRHALMACRLALLDFVPAVALATSAVGMARGAALTAMAVGLVLDRWAFYGLAVRHTTDADLAHAEAAVARLRPGGS